MSTHAQRLLGEHSVSGLVALPIRWSPFRDTAFSSPRGAELHMRDQGPPTRGSCALMGFQYASAATSDRGAARRRATDASIAPTVRHPC